MSKNICIECKENKEGKEYNGFFLCDDCVKDFDNYAEIHRKIDDCAYYFKKFCKELETKEPELLELLKNDVRVRHVVYNFFYFLDKEKNNKFDAIFGKGSSEELNKTEEKVRQSFKGLKGFVYLWDMLFDEYLAMNNLAVCVVCKKVFNIKDKKELSDYCCPKCSK